MKWATKVARKIQIQWLVIKESVERSYISTTLESKPTVLLERKMNNCPARESRSRISN